MKSLFWNDFHHPGGGGAELQSPRQTHKVTSFVTTEPEIREAATGALQSIGSTVSAHDAAAAAEGRTTGIVSAAADNVSALAAAHFAAHAQLCEAVSAQPGTMHALFATMLQAGGRSYAATEFANAAASS